MGIAAMADTVASTKAAAIPPIQEDLDPANRLTNLRRRL